MGDGINDVTGQGVSQIRPMGKPDPIDMAIQRLIEGTKLRGYVGIEALRAELAAAETRGYDRGYAKGRVAGLNEAVVNKS